MKNKVYLAGPIKGLNYDGATTWREYAKEKLAACGLNGFSPMRAKPYLKNETAIDASDTNYNQFPMSRDGAVVCRDRYDATTCDVLLVYLLGAKAISIGTITEIGWADSLRVPIVLVMEDSGNPHEHMFLRQLCAFRVNNLDEGLHIVKSILIP